jgi:hypothetical protein
MERVLLDKQERSRGNDRRPGPVLAEPTAGPALSSLAAPPSAPAPAARRDGQQVAVKPQSSAPAPGFSF